MEVVNIGIIIRNDHNDTFPVALTPSMVQIIQNLLTQIPKLQSKLVDPSGKQIAATESIPIIPRRVTFDWAAAYEPMDADVEKKLMAELNEEYIMDEETMKTEKENTIEQDGKVMKLNPDTGKPAIGQDPQNPFNVELKATGQSNVGMGEAEVAAAMKNADQKLVDNATYPESLKKKEVDQNKPEEIADITPNHKVDIVDAGKQEDGDVTVKIEAPLGLGAKTPAPGGE
jgi:hypothetical protein